MDHERTTHQDRKFTTAMIGLAGLFGVLATVFAPQWAQAQDFQAQDPTRTVVIGTGGKTGVYYPVGVALCDIVNRGRADNGLTCRVESTGGSVDNIQKIQDGELNFGIVQSDILYYAVNGFGPFKDRGADAQLRAVVSLHTEAFTVLARADAGIRTFDDLKGKRVNIGNPGSGQHTFMELFMKVKGWGADVFASTMELPADEQAAALCEGKVDAVVFVVGHPNAAIKNAATACETVLVDVHGPAVHKLLDTYPYFVQAVIPGRKYPGAPASTPTFGVSAVLVTPAKTLDKAVLALTRTIFNSFSDLKFSHPALFALTPAAMAGETTAPMHPGAARFIEKSTNLNELMNVKPPARR